MSVYSVQVHSSSSTRRLFRARWPNYPVVAVLRRGSFFFIFRKGEQRGETSKRAASEKFEVRMNARFLERFMRPGVGVFLR